MKTLETRASEKPGHRLAAPYGNLLRFGRPQRRAAAPWALLALSSLLASAACNEQFTTAPDATGGAGGAPSTCQTLECGDNAECALVQDEPTCVCVEGYEQTEAGCSDIDECAQGSVECPEHASCTNLPGTAECTCDEGYFQDGERCRLRTDIVSIGPDGELIGGSFPSVSHDGRYVAFAAQLPSHSNQAVGQIFVRDMLEGTTVLVSVSTEGEVGNASSSNPSISADGRHVTFGSSASNLVPQDTNGWSDVFVRDLVTETTLRVSVSTAGTQGDDESWGGRISADGSFVVFTSAATNLADRGTPTPVLQPWNALIHDLRAKSTTTVSVAPDGSQANSYNLDPVVSGDGRFVAFSTAATNLVPGGVAGIVVTDRSDSPRAFVHASRNLQQAGGFGDFAEISANGRFVAFVSDWVDGTARTIDSVFVRDMKTEALLLCSQSSRGVAGDGDSRRPSLSADGRFVAFASVATNLVAKDTNRSSDVFVWDMAEGTTIRASVGSKGEQGNHGSTGAALSGDGRFVAFSSSATTFGTPEGGSQVYLRALAPE